MTRSLSLIVGLVALAVVLYGIIVPALETMLEATP